jgi:Ca2+/Na+ antiporter
VFLRADPVNLEYDVKLKTFISINAILLIIFGLGFLFVPARMFSLYGAHTNDLGLFAARAFSVWNIAIGVILWLNQDAHHSGSFRLNLAIFFVTYFLFFCLALQLQITRTLNSLGWLNVILYMALAVGYAFYFINYPPKAIDPQID